MSQIPIYKPEPEIWENEGGRICHLSYTESLDGTRVPAKTFKAGNYSYSSLADAVAQAHRMQASGVVL